MHGSRQLIAGRRSLHRAALGLAALVGALTLSVSPGRPALANQVIGDCTIVSNPTPAHFTNCPDGFLEFADLGHANLTDADLSGANLNHATLTDATLRGATLSGATLRYAILRGADLNGADLSGADLSFATLSHATLREANVSHANVSNADLSNADLSFADFSFTNLSAAALNGVIWDSTTCTDGTNSNNDGGTCAGHLGLSGAPRFSGTGVLLQSSANPSHLGWPVSFTASVTCSGYPPAGAVMFTVGSTTLGTVPVNGAGQAILTEKTLTAGQHTITATVSGTNCGTLTSAPLSQTVR